MQRSRPVALLACLVLVVSASAGSIPALPGDSSSKSPEGTLTDSAAGDGVGSGDVVGIENVAAASVRLDDSSVRRTQNGNTTSRLVLPRDEVEAEQFETVRLGMGTALQSGHDSARHAHRRLAIEREFEAATSQEERQNVIDRGLIELDERTDELEARETAAIRDYSEGTISARTLLEELGRIDAAARQVGTTLDLLDDLGDRAGITHFHSRIRGIEVQARSLQGPVRNRAGRTVAGQAPPKRIFVTGSESGVVLSMLAEGTYFREATNYTNRYSDEEGAVNSPWRRAEELYPWAFAEGGSTDIDGTLTAGAYRITVGHPQGELVAYMDASSADVYREVQTLRLSDIATNDRIVRSDENVRVTLHRTYVGGPLFVHVEDSGSGATINAEVIIDGHEFGHTGDDGNMRVIEPRAPYTVNVTTGETEYNFTVELAVDESQG